MGGMGLALTLRDFKNIMVRPKGIILGLISQMVFLPLVAFAIVQLPGLTPDWKVGIVLVAICPGGATSNLLNFLLRGDLALSVSLAAVNSFLTLFTIPALLHISMEFFLDRDTAVHLPVSDMIGEIFLLTLFPVILGMAIRAKAPVFSSHAKKSLKYIMPSLLAIAMVGAIFFEKKEVVIDSSDYLSVLPHMLILNIVSMMAGFGFGQLSKLGTATSMTISLETGLQNTGLALAIALGSGMLNNAAIGVPAAVYAMFSFFTTLAFGLYVNRKQVSLKEVMKSSTTTIKDPDALPE